MLFSKTKPKPKSICPKCGEELNHDDFNVFTCPNGHTLLREKSIALPIVFRDTEGLLYKLEATELIWLNPNEMNGLIFNLNIPITMKKSFTYN